MEARHYWFINDKENLCTMNSPAGGRGHLRTATRRAPRPRRYLMCPPTYFDVTYSINPWMEPNKPIDVNLAMTRWESLRDIYLEFGHQVEFIDPVAGLPDMVFSANGATVVDETVLLAKFRYQERACEVASYRKWFAARGYKQIHEPRFINEGKGDYLVTYRRLLAGTGSNRPAIPSRNPSVFRLHRNQPDVDRSPFLPP
jgi:N-dimethylarginine dimethylaminohydrolase